MKEIPDKVTLDTNEYHMNLKDYYSRGYNNDDLISKAISHCVQLINLFENEELDFYEDELKDIVKTIERLKDRVENSVWDDDD